MQNNDTQAIARSIELHRQGRDLHARRDYPAAADRYRAALALAPANIAVLADFARLAEDVGDWQAAERAYREIGRRKADSNFEARLGHALLRQGRDAEAVPFLETHLARRPDDADIALALALSRSRLGRWAEAVPPARQAHAVLGTADAADVLLNALLHLDDDDARAESRRLAQHAQKRFPTHRGIAALHALMLLREGELADGLSRLDALRWRNGQQPSQPALPRWDGQATAGVLRVVAEQGLGDEILAATRLPALAGSGMDARVECDDRLRPLFERSFPTLTFCTRGAAPAADETAWAYGLDLACLPGALAATPASLRADPARTAAWRTQLQARFPQRRLVGLAWRSRRTLEGGARKDLAPADLAPLLRDPSLACIALQYGDLTEDFAAWDAQGVIPPALPEALDRDADIDGLAALIAALDAVVTTSNVTAHLAGALQVPALLLLPSPAATFWYWGVAGERTPWYPSLQLLRSGAGAAAQVQQAHALLHASAPESPA